MKFLKQLIATSAQTLLRGYIRFSPFLVGHRFLYEKVCQPYLNSRPRLVAARSKFGAVFQCKTEDLIQRYLYFFGIWEPNLTGYIEKSLKPGDAFIDVGANIGYFSLLASKLVGDSGRVVAIEASPAIFAYLQNNIQRNSAENIRAINVAASNKDDIITVYAAPAGNLGATSILADSGLACECTIAAKPLIEIITKQELESARLIKIDVEGAELPILENLLEALDLVRDDFEIITELSFGMPEKNRAIQGMIEKLSTLGFEPHLLENDYEPTGYLARSPAQAPTLFTDTFEKQVDIVFSRKSDRHQPKNADQDLQSHSPEV